MSEQLVQGCGMTKALSLVVVLISTQTVQAGVGLVEWGHSGVALQAYPEVVESFDSNALASPFTHSIHVQDMDTTLDVAYDFDFDDQAAAFLIGSTHHVENSFSEGASWASGGFSFQPTMPVEITIDGSFAFDVPSIGFEASNYVMVLRHDVLVERPETLWSGWIGSYNEAGSGIESMLETIEVPATGALVDITYYLRLVAEAEAPTWAVADAAGSLEIAVRAVPEPSAGCLVALGIAPLVYRRRRSIKLRSLGS